jgi:hypothetical protein
MAELRRNAIGPGASRDFRAHGVEAPRRRPKPYPSSAPGSLADHSWPMTLRSVSGALDRGPGPEGRQHAVVEHEGNPRLALAPGLEPGKVRDLPRSSRSTRATQAAATMRNSCASTPDVAAAGSTPPAATP